MKKDAASSKVQPEVASAELIELLFDRAGTGLCLVAPDGTVLRANSEWLRFTGSTLDRTSGANLLELCPDSAGWSLAPHDGARAGGTPPVPCESPRTNGCETRWERTVSPVPMASGTGMLIAVREVAHEVASPRGLEAEQPVRERETFLRNVIDTTPSLVFVKDRDGRFVLANEALARCYGTTIVEIVGKTDADFNPNADEVAAFLRDDREVMRTRQEKVIVEEPVTRADGELRWFSTVKVPLIDPDGSCDKVLGVATDVTDRKRAEEALRRGEERFRRLIESSVIGLVIGDDAGRITYANLVLLEMIGYTREELLEGKVRWDALTPPEYLPLDAKALADLAADGRTAPYEKVYVTKDGRHVPILIGVVPIDRTSSGGLVLAAYVVDLSARKRMEEALREADQRKDEFLAMLAHELRNPLAAISSAASVIRGRLSQGHSIDRPLEILERQIRNSARLLDDLLDVSRITRGILQVKKEEVRLDAVLQSAVDSQRALIDAARQRLTISMPHAPIHVEGDPTRLEQIVSNLLNNAAKYTPEGGSIGLSVEAPNGEVVIRVTDTGSGIPAELLPRVFDLFVQEKQSLARTKGGLGLGLTLVRTLVEMHGGSVEARSGGIGEGSEFIVRLPAVTRERGTAPPAGAGGQPEGRRRRILLVEDNFDAAELLTEFLESLGHEVTVAHDGPAALECAARVRPDVVLLDIGLPGMDGYEVGRRLRADPAPPILIALTGYGQEEDRNRSREAGFAHHLTKPFEAAALERLLAELAPPS